MAPGEFWVPLEPDGPGEQRSVVVLPSPRIAAPLIPIDWKCWQAPEVKRATPADGFTTKTGSSTDSTKG